jgi:hypothetical protein
MIKHTIALFLPRIRWSKNVRCKGTGYTTCRLLLHHFTLPNLQNLSRQNSYTLPTQLSGLNALSATRATQRHIPELRRLLLLDRCLLFTNSYPSGAATYPARIVNITVTALTCVTIAHLEIRLATIRPPATHTHTHTHTPKY